jgi:uroporphyrinogen decarboxylase
MKNEMTSLERILTALSQKEPDRVPFLLLAGLHGAKYLGISLKEYFSRSENVAEGQLLVYKRYRQDGVMSFFYGAIEVEAWGGEVIFFDDGPPNSGMPMMRRLEDINTLVPPHVQNSPCLQKVLETIRLIKDKVADEAPVFGVVMSPFSFPVMQMGFDKYIELLYERPEYFQHLMHINEEFCVEWANAQLNAGCTAIVYFDPVSSTTIIPREMYLNTGFPVARHTIGRIKGPTITHMASGRCLPIIDDIAQTGTAVVGVSVLENLTDLKIASAKRLTLLGNLNAIEMRRWSPQQAEQIVKTCIARAARGGGFILSDNHGEIPFQVPDEILMAVSEAVHKWGQYPLNWIEQN